MTLDMEKMRKQIVADKEELTRKIAENCAEEWSGLVDESATNLSDVLEKGLTAAERLEKCASGLQFVLAQCGRTVELTKDMEKRAVAMATASKVAEKCAEEWCGLVGKSTLNLNDMSEKAQTAVGQFEKCASELQSALAECGRTVELAKGMGEKTAAVAEASKASEKCAKEWNVLVIKSAANLGDMSEKAQTAMEQLEKCVGELQFALAECSKTVESAKGMEERIVAMAEASKGLAGDVDRIKAVVDDFVCGQKEIWEEAIDRLNQSFEKIIKVIRFGGNAFSDELNSAGDRIKLTMENSAGKIQNYCRKIEGYIRKYADENGRGIQAAENFRRELVLFYGRIVALETEVRKELDCFVADISQSGERLVEFEEQIASGNMAMEKMIQSFDSRSRQVEEELDELSQKAGEYLKCLEASCNAAEGLLQTRKKMDQLNEKKEKGRFYILAAMISVVVILQIWGFFF